MEDMLDLVPYSRLDSLVCVLNMLQYNVFHRTTAASEVPYQDNSYSKYKMLHLLTVLQL